MAVPPSQRSSVPGRPRPSQPPGRAGRRGAHLAIGLRQPRERARRGGAAGGAGAPPLRTRGRGLSAARPVSLPALLAETFSVQALGTMAVLTIRALAPAVAQTLGVSTVQVGYQVAVIYIAAMLGSLSAGACVATFGPSRTGQIAMLLDAAGCLVASLATIPAIVAGSLLIGCAYGLINPAASELLNHYNPPNRRNLVFSIKQTGVPAGGVAAGLLGPTLALAAGWHAVLWAVAAACILVALAAQPGRAALDMHRGAGRVTGFSLLALRGVFAARQLRWLALSSFCFSAVQLCLVAFLVALLVEELGLGLVLAGAVLATVQVAGAGGRVLW